jgi:hypothetical protein
MTINCQRLYKSVNRYVLRIVTLTRILIRMYDNLRLLIAMLIQNTKLLCTWGEGANVQSPGTETALPSAVNMEDWHMGESFGPNDEKHSWGNN